MCGEFKAIRTSNFQRVNEYRLVFGFGEWNRCATNLFNIHFTHQRLMNEDKFLFFVIHEFLFKKIDSAYFGISSAIKWMLIDQDFAFRSIAASSINTTGNNQYKFTTKNAQNWCASFNSIDCTICIGFQIVSVWLLAFPDTRCPPSFAVNVKCLAKRMQFSTASFDSLVGFCW